MYFGDVAEVEEEVMENVEEEEGLEGEASRRQSLTD
jgi:hypothetical protein